MAPARLPAPLSVVAAVFGNASLRRVLLAFIGFSLAEWTSWIAILVYAFNRGGATETGIAALVQLAPSAIVALPWRPHSEITSRGSGPCCWPTPSRPCCLTLHHRSSTWQRPGRQPASR